MCPSENEHWWAFQRHTLREARACLTSAARQLRAMGLVTIAWRFMFLGLFSCIFVTGTDGALEHTPAKDIQIDISEPR